MPRRVGAYGKLLANYASDDAVIAAGEAAELLFVRGIAFCATSDSDGYITDGQLVRVVGAGMRDAVKRARRLVEVGLWLRDGDGYQVRSHLKINESAEEKGRALATDRERKRAEREAESKRSPNGHGPTSERTAEPSPPESLDCTYVSPLAETVQSSPIQSSAGTTLAPLAAPTAQTIVGEWMDYVAKRPPSAVIGQTSKHIAAMLAEDIDPDDVRRGVRAWSDKGLHPSALPSVVNEVMNSRGGSGTRKRTTDDRVRDGLDLAQRLAFEDNPQRQIGA